MTHLTDEQLSARLDDALAADARAECDAHLATCEPCRARLAELSSLDRELGSALTHDPGEAYFAGFAGRVAARIAAGEAGPASAAGAPGTPVSRRSPWAWLVSPRGLSFAGGMAALLLAAGIAWHVLPHEHVGSEFRAAAPGERAAAPPGANAPQSRDERSPTESPGAEPQPARERKAEESGGPEAGRAPSPQAPAAPASGELKKQPMAKHQFATAPPPGEPAARALAVPPQPAAEKDALAPGVAQSLSAGAPATRNEAQATSRRADQVQLQAEAAPALVIQCGKVTDTRGTPLGGVQITLLGASTRSSRSAADGSFCLPRAVAGDTLILMHVGFEPVRLVLAPSTSLAFGLEPIGTLGSRGGLVFGGRPEGLLQVPPAAPAPAPDVYAGEPDSVRVAVTRARQRTASVRHNPTASGWEAAASSWEGIAAKTSGRAGAEARFEELSALHEAWRLAPTPARAERLRGLLAAFVSSVPATLPERATAIRWQEELATPARH